MCDDKKSSKNVDHASLIGPLWFIGWLFTIGFTQLSFWKAVWALLVWPYYLGVTLAM